MCRESKNIRIILNIFYIACLLLYMYYDGKIYKEKIYPEPKGIMRAEAKGFPIYLDSSHNKDILNL